MLPERFILYRREWDAAAGKWQKIPCGPDGHNINHLDPSQWMTFAQASALATWQVDDPAKPHGVAWVLNGDGWFFLDLDNCHDGAGWSSEATMIYRSFPGALSEVSTSGKGLHIFGRCDPHTMTQYRNKWDGWLEFYTTGRSVALTQGGLHVIGGGQYADRDWTTQLTALVPERPDMGDLPTERDPAYTGPEDDDKLIEMMLRSGSTASKFGNAATVKDLWDANVTVLSRMYPAYSEGGDFDHSAADAALMSHLAFWTGKDAPRMDRLFRRSSLMRPKYERKDYRTDTISGAVRMCQRVYDVPARDVPSSPSGTSHEALLSVAEQIEHFSGCVYVRDIHRVLVPDGSLLKPEQFNATYGGHVFQMTVDGTKPSKKAFEALTENMAYRFPQAKRTMFRADLPFGQILGDEVNVYVKHDAAHRRMDITRFHEYLAKLIPNERDRMILISWCAAMVQYPGVKFQWSPVLQGTEGNGKSLVASCLTYALGEQYVYEPRASQIGGQFISFDENKLLIIIEEVHMGGRRQTLDDLKPRITNRRVEVEGKGQDKRLIINTANWFFCTNYRDAVIKTRNDRRYAIFFTAQQSIEDIVRDGMAGDYFPNLYRWLRDEGGYAGVLGYLMTFSIPDEFNPATLCHRAPETTSTEQAVAITMGGIEAEIQEAVDSEEPGFRGGWISSAALDRMIRDRGIRISKPRLGEILTELGYTQWGRCPRPIMREGGKRPVLWCNGTQTGDYWDTQGVGYN